MVAKTDVLLMVKVAQLYYMCDMEHEKIAEELNISQSSISDILSDAVQYGIVEVKIRNCI